MSPTRMKTLAGLRRGHLFVVFFFSKKPFLVLVVVCN